MINITKKLFSFKHRTPAIEPQVQVRPEPQEDVAHDVVDFLLQNGEINLGIYSGTLKKGLPDGPGKLVLPGNHGVLLGQFSLDKNTGATVVLNGSLSFPNGDSQNSRQIDNSRGHFSAKHIPSHYTYANGDRAALVMRNGQVSSQPGDTGYHPFVHMTTTEKLALKKKIAEKQGASKRGILSVEENMLAWVPQKNLLVALNAILQHSITMSSEKSWSSQVSLMRGLVILFENACDYLATDVSGVSVVHAPFIAYPSQLEHIASTVYDSTASIELDLIIDNKPNSADSKERVTMLFHPEGDKAFRQQFRSINMQKANLFLIAYEHDTRRRDKSMQTVTALLDGYSRMLSTYLFPIPSVFFPESWC